jgi:hypothetical protein
LNVPELPDPCAKHGNHAAVHSLPSFLRGGRIWFVLADKCKCDGPFRHSDTYEDARGEAIRAWNERQGHHDA